MRCSTSMPLIFGTTTRPAAGELRLSWLLDLKLPKDQWHGVLQRIARRNGTDSAVVILTSSDEERDVIDGYRPGREQATSANRSTSWNSLKAAQQLAVLACHDRTRRPPEVPERHGCADADSS